jgi:acyl-CoA thioesterase FadM
MKYQQIYQVRGFEIGQDYRLKPYLLPSYFQNTMGCHFADAKLAAYDLQKDGRTWVLSDMKIEFLDQMPYWREEVLVETWNSKLKGFRVYREFTISSTSDDKKLIARGTSVWLPIDETTKRPVKIDEYADRLPLHPEENFPNYKSDKLVIPDDLAFPKADPSGLPQDYSSDQRTWSLQQRVRSYDIDFNGHVSNIRYIGAAIESIPYELRKTLTPRGFEIKYIKEALYKDLGEALCFAIDGTKKMGHLVRIAETGEELCQMVSYWE